jgi:hypothetical protein
MQIGRIRRNVCVVANDRDGLAECPRCHARMRIVAAVTEQGAIERILRHLGEHSTPPSITVPRAPPSDDEEAAPPTRPPRR